MYTYINKFHPPHLQYTFLTERICTFQYRHFVSSSISDGASTNGKRWRRVCCHDKFENVRLRSPCHVYVSMCVCMYGHHMRTHTHKSASVCMKHNVRMHTWPLTTDQYVHAQTCISMYIHIYTHIYIYIYIYIYT